MSFGLRNRAGDTTHRKKDKTVITLIVVEASGGFEQAMVTELVTVSLPIVVVNPTCVRNFARAKGQIAQTDPIDSRSIAAYIAWSQ